MPKVTDSKYIVFAGWDDVPHLSTAAKKEMLASCLPHQRLARSKGIPTLGSGNVFPFAEDDITITPFPIPDHWIQIGGMDFGWNHPWAAVHLAYDRDKDTMYVVKDYRKSELTPPRAMEALKSWEPWLPWAWPHDGHQHGKGDGKELAPQYREAGFDMLEEHATFPESEGGGYGLEAGITKMYTRMEAGTWKVFSTCALWLEEYRMYHRKDGLIVKERDDVISASRYGSMMIARYGKRRPTGVNRKLQINKNWRVA